MALPSFEVVIPPTPRTIPFPTSPSDFYKTIPLVLRWIETQTKAEIFFLEGREDMIILSFDCKDCKGEVPLSGDSMAWAPGAEHIYAGKSVSKDYKYSFKSNKVEIGYRGLIIFVSNAGSLPRVNKIKGWVIKGDPDAPLIFKVVKDLGYVYTGGRGVVIAPDGTTHNMGD